MARRPLLLALLSAGTATAFACLPGGGPGLLEPEDAAVPESPSLDEEDAGASRADVDLGDSFALLGLSPSHGPWTGGTRAVLRGRGFGSNLRVRIGSVALPPSEVIATNPARAAVVIPPGKSGPVDVTVRDEATGRERTLPSGFVYDPFVVEPASGATTGGTRIRVRADEARFAAGTTVTIAGKPCTDVVVEDNQTLACTTPPNAPGAADVVVAVTALPPLQVRDAFAYNDSPDGFRGGLAGGALSGRLRVIALDGFTGLPLEGGHVIVGGDMATALRARVNAAGIAEFQDPTLENKATVTVAAKCHDPITIVDVPVDTVTVYLPLNFDPSCGTPDPGSIGGRGGRGGGEIRGELVWPRGVEFQRGEWTNVPLPVRPSERRAAYVFLASGSPNAGFALPDARSAVTPESPGSRGYEFGTFSWPGTSTLYALAGIEDRSTNPPRFTAYVMGVARGVQVPPGSRVEDVAIPMTSVLDHTVTFAASPPLPGPRGPDRLVTQVAVTVGPNQFAILPSGSRTTPLPSAPLLPFVGVPALADGLTGEWYSVGVSAVTGSGWSAPASVVSRFRTRDTTAPLKVDGFLPIPILRDPAPGGWSGTRVEYDASGTFDLMTLNIASADGVVDWTIVAPGATRSFAIPDLRSLRDVDLPRGAFTATAYVARIDGFDYARLRSGQWSSGAWNAYAIDTFTGVY
jgi:hypothetical protein